MRCATEWTLIDTETTGLFAPIHVVEVAAVRMRGWEPTGETFQAFPVPGRQHQVRGVGGQFQGKCAPYALGGAGQDDGFV